MHSILSPLLILALSACRAVPPDPPVVWQDATVRAHSVGGYMQFAASGEFGDLLVVVRGDRVTALLNGEVLPESQVQNLGDRIVVSDADGHVLHDVDVSLPTRDVRLVLSGVQPGNWSLATSERRKLIGVSTSPADDALKAQLGVEGDALVIETVNEDMPAAKAGVQPLDVVVAIEGQPGATTARLREVLETKQPGDALHLAMRRHGEPLELELVVEPARDADAAIGAYYVQRDAAPGSDPYATLLANRETIAAQRAELDARLADLRAEAEALAQRSGADVSALREQVAARQAQAEAERALLESRLAPGAYTMTLLGDGERRSLVVPQWWAAESGGDSRLDRLEERLARLEDLLEMLAARHPEPAPEPSQP